MAIPHQRTETSWDLVTRTQAGDVAAFDEIYRHYRQLIHRYVRARAHSSHVDDLTSEVFARALKSIGGITNQGRDLGAWLITIARHVVVDYYKSAVVRMELIESYFNAESDIPRHSTPVVEVTHYSHPEAVAEHRSDRAQILAAMAHLSDRQSTCIVLRYFEDLTVAETGAILGLNEAAVKALTWRAIRNLRHQLLGGQTLLGRRGADGS